MPVPRPRATGGAAGRHGAQGRRHSVLAASLCVAVAVVLLRHVPRAWLAGAPAAASAEEGKPSRSALRRLLAAGVVAPALPAVAAPKGTNFQVTWEGSIGDDIVFGGGAGQPTVPQSTPRVLKLAPGGTADKAGVKVGDEVSLVRLTENRFYQESFLRMSANPDATIKQLAGKEGITLNFRSMGMIQPGEQAPDFACLDTSGNEVNLATLRENGKPVVMFFRPGKRFVNGDKSYMKLLARASPAFKEIGASAVSITTDDPGFQKSWFNKLESQMPFLFDNGVTLKNYGADTDVTGLGLVADRKTVIIGTDGKVQAVFPAVGWDVAEDKLVAHIMEVGRALGGDPEQFYAAAVQTGKSVGQFLAR